MSELVGLLEYGGIGVFAALGLAGVLQWGRRRDPAGGWLALTFVLLAVVVVVASTPLYPGPGHPRHVVAGRVLAVALLVVPYLQYRFMASFSARPRGEELAVAAAALAVVAGAMLVPDFAVAGEPQTAAFVAYLVAALIYWVVLAVHVAVRLWREGRAQPMVTRGRIRTLAVGSLGMAAAVVLSSGTTSGIVHVLALAAGVTLLAGVAPPPALRAWWRRRQGALHW